MTENIMCFIAVLWRVAWSVLLPIALGTAAFWWVFERFNVWERFDQENFEKGDGK